MIDDEQLRTVHGLFQKAKGHASRGDLLSTKRYCIASADLCLEIIKNAQGQPEKSHYRELLAEIIELAEKASSTLPSGVVASSEQGVVHAQSHSKYAELAQPSRAEELIILRGSRILTGTFVPWKEQSPPNFYEIYFEHGRQQALAADYHDIVQNNQSGNCALIVALIVATQWFSKYNQPGLACSISQISTPGTSASEEEYAVRLFFNGSPRRVLLTHASETLTQANSACSRLSDHDDYQRNSKLCLALIEKAYTTVVGNQEGSDSATDLKMILDWIPEQKILSSGQSSSYWRTISAAWQRGEVLLSLGTKRETADMQRTDLVPNHSYAVTAIIWHSGSTSITIQNPFNQDWCSHILSTTSSDVSSDFTALYMSWNPSPWPYRTTAHFNYSIEMSSLSSMLLYMSQQYILHNPSPHDVETLIVLSRHRTGKLEDAQVYAVMVLFDSDQRVTAMLGHTSTTEWSCSLDITLRCVVPAQSKKVLAISQARTMEAHSYTLTAHTKVPLSNFLVSIPNTFPHVSRLEGSWSIMPRMEDLAESSYNRNPHFFITIGEQTDLNISLDTGEPLDVALHLYHSHKIRTKHSKEDLVLGNAEYRRSYAVLAKRLGIGKYTLVAAVHRRSTRTAKFEVTVQSMRTLSIDLARPIGHNQLKNVFRSSWTTRQGDTHISFETLRSNRVTIYLYTDSLVNARMSLSIGARRITSEAGYGAICINSIILERSKGYTLLCEYLSKYALRGEVPFVVEMYSDGALQCSND